MLMSRFRAEFRETARVLAKFQAEARKAIYYQAGFVMKTARRSIVSADHASRPGHPPRSVCGQLRDFIFFKWDDASQSMVIGPAAFKSDSTVPAILEGGGTEPATVKVGTKWEHRPVTIEPRPYMAPAFEVSQTRLPDFWAKSIE